MIHQSRSADLTIEIAGLIASTYSGDGIFTVKREELSEAQSSLRTRCIFVISSSKQAWEDQQLDAPGSMSDGGSNRILVNGLPPDTTRYMIENFFSQLGTLTECTVLFDRESNTCRGYAFISFLDNRCMEECLRSQCHINGVKVHLRAINEDEHDSVMCKIPVKKILVSFLGGSLSKHRIHEYFSDFGRVKVGYCRDNEDEEHYAYVMFEDEFACSTCLAIREHSIDGHLVEIRAVVRKEDLMIAEQAERERAERDAVLSMSSDLGPCPSSGAQSLTPISTMASHSQQQVSDFTKAQQVSNQSYPYGPPCGWPVACSSTTSAVDVASGHTNYTSQVTMSYPAHLYANDQCIGQQFHAVGTLPDCTLPPPLISRSRNMIAPANSTYVLKRQQTTFITSPSKATTAEPSGHIYSRGQLEDDGSIAKLCAHDGTLSSALAGYGSWDRQRYGKPHDATMAFRCSTVPSFNSNAEGKQRYSEAYWQ